MPTLYYSRNPKRRLAVAVARYLDTPVTLEWADPFAGSTRPRCRLSLLDPRPKGRASRAEPRGCCR